MLTFRALALLQNESDEGLTLETSAFEQSLHGGQFTFLLVINSVDKPLNIRVKCKAVELQNCLQRVLKQNSVSFI